MAAMTISTVHVNIVHRIVFIANLYATKSFLCECDHSFFTLCSLVLVIPALHFQLTCAKVVGATSSKGFLVSVCCLMLR